MQYLKEWTKIFKALGNETRLQIVQLLNKEKELPVHAVSARINRGVKSVSKHLSILSNIGFLQSHGKLGSVYYYLHPELRKEIRHIMVIFLRK